MTMTSRLRLFKGISPRISRKNATKACAYHVCDNMLFSNWKYNYTRNFPIVFFSTSKENNNIHNGGSSSSTRSACSLGKVMNDDIHDTSTNNNNKKNKNNNIKSQCERPFHIIGLQQIAIGSHPNQKDKMTHLWKEIFGLAQIGDYTSERENVVEDIFKLGGYNGNDNQNNNDIFVEVDLMCPLDPTRSPKVHEPPLNHIGLWVDDLQSAVTWMTQQGVRFTPGGIRKGASGYDVIFIHPKSNHEYPIGGNGVLIELVQAPSHVIHHFRHLASSSSFPK